MQDATQLIKNSGLRRVAGAITDVAALGQRAILGHGRNAENQKRNQENKKIIRK